MRSSQDTTRFPARCRSRIPDSTPMGELGRTFLHKVLPPFNCCRSRNNIHFHSFQGSFLENHQKPWGNGWFLKRARAEKNGKGIKPIESRCFSTYLDAGCRKGIEGRLRQSSFVNGPGDVTGLDSQLWLRNSGSSSKHGWCT